jgi:Mn-containing catalase
VFYHVKELQFDARVSGPDPRFASLLLEQFGGGNGELKAAMQYFTQAFATKKPFPKTYDLLMDIAAEEFSHLEIVGATIMMLLQGVNGQLKDAAERADLMRLLNGNKQERDELIQQSMADPQFLCLTGGGPKLTNSQGVPWSGSYVNANGDPTVDLRSNIAAESRAKIVYEYLLQFTDDPHVQATLQFLMTREIAHFQQFQAALETIEPNFPPGVLQGDPRYTHLYFNMSNGESVRGPWNEGQGPWPAGEEWVYIEDPIDHVMATNGLVEQPVDGAKATQKATDKKNKSLSKRRSEVIQNAMPPGEMAWNEYERSP